MHIVPFVSNAKKMFQFYKSLGEKTFEQLPDKKLFTEIDQHLNNIPILVKHLHGNMMSRWTDFLISDGEKEWRERDKEFEFDITSREEMMTKWEEGWNCLFEALDAINTENGAQIVYIRNQGHTIEEAVTRQLCHYAYHIGQIVYIGKASSGTNWKPLSIPKDKSHEYNDKKFAMKPNIEHFTDDFIK